MDYQVGKVYGKLKVIDYAESREGEERVFVRCSCKKVKVVNLSSLRSGGTTSCGCGKAELPKPVIGQVYGNLTVVDEAVGAMVRTRCTCGSVNFTKLVRLAAGDSCGCESSLGDAWELMWLQTTDCSVKGYINKVGSPEINVCESWLIFENFYADMAQGWEKGSSLARRDKAGDFNKENCYWDTEVKRRKQHDTRTKKKKTCR